MDSKLWGQLADNLVEDILLLLPVRELCQLRCVSKMWNDLITSARFAIAHTQRAAHSPSTPFIATRCWILDNNYFREDWSFLDLESYNWRTFTDNHAPLHPRQHDYSNRVAFMNDGLVCRYVTPADKLSDCVTGGTTFAIKIYNPVGISSKELPSVKCHSSSLSNYDSRVLPILISVLDNVTSTFKVLFINQHVISRLNPTEEMRNEPFMKIYDSVTNEWRVTSQPFCIATRGVGPNLRVVVLNGFLYVLFGASWGYLSGHLVEIPRSLSRYNLATDTWEQININMDDCPPEVQFFATTDRLYYLGWMDSGESIFKLELHEILVPEMTVTTTFSLSKDETVLMLENEACLKPTLEVTGVAFRNSVMLMSRRSKNACVLDLETQVWNHVPRCTAWAPQSPTRDSFSSNYAQDSYHVHFPTCWLANLIGNTNLILPNSLW